ncbi:MAG: hypothetical protein DRP91_09915 [Candidatus Neomarinimicrobiota bacterium]|nr:MAG: hypothetical protein DRP91_09915 [Candidatus Neomarinimicrobiota bacterium]
MLIFSRRTPFRFTCENGVFKFGGTSFYLIELIRNLRYGTHFYGALESLSISDIYILSTDLGKIISLLVCTYHSLVKPFIDGVDYHVFVSKHCMDIPDCAGCSNPIEIHGGVDPNIYKLKKKGEMESLS